MDVAIPESDEVWEHRQHEVDRWAREAREDANASMAIIGYGFLSAAVVVVVALVLWALGT